MFDFIRKPELWDALDRGWCEVFDVGRAFHLKSIQDFAVYRRLKDAQGLDILEVGGGDSRLLRQLAPYNRCFNLEKFEGADVGPKQEVRIDDVTNVNAFLGEFDPRLEADALDVVFSVSVVEHVPTNRLDDFLADGLRVLRPGGLWLHAIDMYLEDEVPDHILTRFDVYRSWASPEKGCLPEGHVYSGPPRFSCDMATNPDNVLHDWGRLNPALTGLRQRAQSVSVLVASRKSG